MPGNTTEDEAEEAEEAVGEEAEAGAGVAGAGEAGVEGVAVGLGGAEGDAATAVEAEVEEEDGALDEPKSEAEKLEIKHPATCIKVCVKPAEHSAAAC